MAKTNTRRTIGSRVGNTASRAASSRAVHTTGPARAYIQNLYNRSAPLLICEATLLSIAAIFMIFRPVAMLGALTFIIGVGLILFGLYRTIAGFMVSDMPGGGWIDVIFGLINIVLGVLFCAFPAESAVGVVYVFIALLLFKATKALIFAINMARARAGHFVMDMTVAVLLFILAAGLFFFPIIGEIALIYTIAIVLFLYAASDIYMFIELVHLKNSVAK